MTYTYGEYSDYYGYPGCMVGYLSHFRRAYPISECIDSFQSIIAKTHKEKMYHTNKPQRSNRNEAIWYDGASALLYIFTDYVTKRETDKTDSVYPFTHSKNACHPVSMEKYISIDKGIDE